MTRLALLLALALALTVGYYALMGWLLVSLIGG